MLTVCSVKHTNTHIIMHQHTVNQNFEAISRRPKTYSHTHTHTHTHTYTHTITLHLSALTKDLQLPPLLPYSLITQYMLFPLSCYAFPCLLKLFSTASGSLILVQYDHFRLSPFQFSISFPIFLSFSLCPSLSLSLFSLFHVMPSHAY